MIFLFSEERLYICQNYKIMLFFFAFLELFLKVKTDSFHRFNVLTLFVGNLKAVSFRFVKCEN